MTVAENVKPLPVPDPDSRPFWDACAEHRLVAQRCGDCGTWRFPPGGFCPACSSRQAAWEPLAGTGVVQSFVVPHRAYSVAFEADLPYVIAHVEMDGTGGKVVVVGNVVGCVWTDVRVGLPVRVDFDDRAPGVAVPRFTPQA
jgi:uncharacterized OB-fold protein